jgi:hypothetical protein
VGGPPVWADPCRGAGSLMPVPAEHILIMSLPYPRLQVSVGRGVSARSPKKATYAAKKSPRRAVSGFRGSMFSTSTHTRGAAGFRSSLTPENMRDAIMPPG